MTSRGRFDSVYENVRMVLPFRMFAAIFVRCKWVCFDALRSAIAFEDGDGIAGLSCPNNDADDFATLEIQPGRTFCG